MLEGAGQLDEVEKLEHALAAFGHGLADAELLERAQDLRAHGVRRVQRVEGILEHHLDRCHSGGWPGTNLHRLDLLARQPDLAAGRGLEPEENLCEG